jgi:5-methylcytosine-specific restriction protein A
VDHVVPHKGDSVKFWDESNHQALCTRCHNRKTARGE